MLITSLLYRWVRIFLVHFPNSLRIQLPLAGCCADTGWFVMYAASTGGLSLNCHPWQHGEVEGV